MKLGNGVARCGLEYAGDNRVQYGGKPAEYHLRTVTESVEHMLEICFADSIQMIFDFFMHAS